jgi:S1-C subfamily serine protease
MYGFSLLLTVTVIAPLMIPGAAVASVASVAEVQSIAQAVSVEIRLQKNKTVGSGVIIHRQGDLYTLVTNRHVVCGTRDCKVIAEQEVYSLGLADGQKYRVQKKAVKLFSNDLDLAIIQFRSDRNYKVAKVAPLGSLKTTDKVYTAGFPFEQPGFAFGKGEAFSVVNNRLTEDGGGYTIIYDASTLPGMSGGGVFDRSGQLVAIHGQGDRYQENTELSETYRRNSKIGFNGTYRINSKIGYNRGIPSHWLIESLSAIGIQLDGIKEVRSLTTAIKTPQTPRTAD